MRGVGLVAVATPQEVTNRITEVGTPIDKQEVIDSLASYLKTCWESARDHKQTSGLTERLLECDRQRRGEYSPTKLAEIRKTGGSEIYMMLTDIKCRAALSWIKDVMSSYGDETWTLEPTAEPNLDVDLRQAIIEGVAEEARQAFQQGLTQPDVLAFRERIEEMEDEVIDKLREAAKRAAAGMERHIRDQLQEGGWDKAFSEFMNDFVTYPAAFIKGPVVRRKQTMRWGKNHQPVVTTEAKRTFKRVSPYDAFPSREATSVQDGYFFERVRFSIADLMEVRDVRTYRAEKIDEVIEQYSRGGLRDWLYGDQEKAFLDGKGTQLYTNPNETMDGLEFWGRCRGKDLIEWGLTKGIKANQSYEITAILIGNNVIRAALNPDPLGMRPYSSASFDEIPGTMWGSCPPELMRDLQSLCNAAARALANNMAIASGPMVEVTIDRLPDGEKVTNLYPWKLFQTTSDKTGGGQGAIKFYQPNMHVQELLEIFRFFSTKADEATGIPNYVYGSGQSGGAGRTAHGLAMLMDNASKGIKQAIGNIDVAITFLIGLMYTHNMLYDDNEHIKGDMQIVAKGALGMVMREQLQEKRQSFLQATMNPIDSQIMGAEGRAYLLGEVARPLQLDTTKIVPGPRQLQERAQQMAAQQAAAAGSPLENINFQRDADGAVTGAQVMPGAQ